MKRFLPLLMACLLLIASSGMAEDTRKGKAPESIFIGQEDAQQIARANLLAQYGLTDGILGRFFEEVYSYSSGNDEGAWRIHYIPSLHTGYLRTYIVDIDAVTAETLSITHTLGEIHDPLDSTSLFTDPVWDAPQLQTLLTLLTDSENALRTKEETDGPFSTWTLEARAAFDAPFVSAQVPLDGERVYNILPGLEDLPEEDALKRATEALSSQFGLPDAKLSALYPHPSFTIDASGTRIWTFTFSPQEDLTLGFEYLVRLDSPQGDILDCLRGNGVEVWPQQELVLPIEEAFQAALAALRTSSDPDLLITSTRLLFTYDDPGTPIWYATIELAYPSRMPAETHAIALHAYTGDLIWHFINDAN